jgi:hypothetical protein
MYGGLVLNDFSTADRYNVMKVDGLLGFPDMKVVELARSEDHGSLDTMVYYGGRTITLTGRIEAHTLSKMREMVYDLRMAFGDIERESALYIQSYWTEDRYLMCRKSTALQITEEQRNRSTYYRDFVITLRASDPRIMSVEMKTASATFNSSTPQTMTVTNNGNFPSWVRYRVFSGSGSGSVTNPKVTTLGLNSGFYYQDVISATSTTWTEFNLRERAVMRATSSTALNSIGTPNLMPVTTNAYYGATFVWPTGLSGADTMTVSCSSTTGIAPTLNVYYQDTWV